MTLYQFRLDPGIFSNYLSERTPCVKIDSHSSGCASLDYGVPRGSVFGVPNALSTVHKFTMLLFTKLSIPNFSIVTYADDIELLVLVTCVMHADFGELPLGLVMLWLSKNYFILIKPPT